MMKKTKTEGHQRKIKVMVAIFRLQMRKTVHVIIKKISLKMHRQTNKNKNDLTNIRLEFTLKPYFILSTN